jgi:hypothetical protein
LHLGLAERIDGGDGLRCPGQGGEINKLAAMGGVRVVADPVAESWPEGSQTESLSWLCHP